MCHVPLPASSEQARVGPNGKHTFLITGPLTGFPLSNVNPEQWKTNSSRKLGAMNYRIPNKYMRKGNDHLTILREEVAGHGWLLCFFFQGMWALFLYIVLCLRVLPWGNSWSNSDNLFCLLPPWHLSVGTVPVLPVGIKKILEERISCPPLPLAVVALGWCSPCLPQFSLWNDTDLSHGIHVVEDLFPKTTNYEHFSDEAIHGCIFITAEILAGQGELLGPDTGWLQ